MGGSSSQRRLLVFPRGSDVRFRNVKVKELNAETVGGAGLNGTDSAPKTSHKTSTQHSSATWTSPSTQMAFVRIDGGEFMMGSPEGQGDDDASRRREAFQLFWFI